MVYWALAALKPIMKERMNKSFFIDQYLKAAED
jgi:hypothetical protein